MTRLEFLRGQIEWAERILAMPADQLPGTLTHDKAAAVAIEAEIEMVDFLAVQVTPAGLRWVHVEPAPNE